MQAVEPQGVLNVHSYISDSAGCGYIRVMLPNTYLSS